MGEEKCIWLNPTGPRVYRLWRHYIGKGGEIVKLTEPQAEEWRTGLDYQRLGEFISDDTYETFQEALAAWGDMLAK